LILDDVEWTQGVALVVTRISVAVVGDPSPNPKRG